MSEELRKLAEMLRVEEKQRLEAKRQKCAQILSAASGLELLRRKLGGPNAG